MSFNSIVLQKDLPISFPNSQFFHFEKKGLIVSGNPTFAEWMKCGEFIRVMEKNIHFWIGDWLNYGEQRYGEMYSQAIGETGYDYKTLRDDKWVSSRIELSRRRDNLSFSHHKNVAGFEPDEQNRLLELAEKDNLTREVFRQTVRTYKHSKLPPTIIPEGEFNVIYADPPWKYDFSETESREIENQYPTMELEEIKQLKIPSASDSVLFLWSTAPKLREALDVISAWGFEYRTNAVWDKEIIGMGYWFRGQHEIILVGTKGNPPIPGQSDRESSVYREKRIQHSKKPDYYYSLIEKYFPEGKYLELFSRKKFNEKWCVYGNQLQQ